MIYAFLVGGTVFASALALWFRHRAADLQQDKDAAVALIAQKLKRIDALQSELDDQGKRLNAIIRGKELEIRRLEKLIAEAFESNPALAGEYVRSGLSLPEDSDTTADYSIVPASTVPKGGPGKGGGST